MEPIMLSILSTEYFTIYEYYAKKFSELYVNPIIFLEYNIILLTAFLIRLTLLFKIESRKRSKNVNDRKNKYTYIFRHIGIEWFIATLVTYSIVKSTNALLDSYIINLMIAPFTGFIVGVFLDLKLLIPVESNTMMGSIMSVKKSKRDDSQSNINININQYSDRQDEQTQDKNEILMSTLDEKILEDEENFNENILDTLNRIIHTQNKQSKQIDETDGKLNSIIKSIDYLRESNMIDKQVSLKHMIYQCLNNGFATPEENDKITKMYYAYHELLGGNHEVESLYNDHYLKLSIHEDRRIANKPVNVERRSNSTIPYGVYDNE